VSTTRTFYMGFTPTPYDATGQALDATYRFIQRHGDLVAHHLDKGVPWPEAYDELPYPLPVERDLRTRQGRRVPGQQVLVALSPIAADGGLGGYWGASGNMPRPGPWKARDFDDPRVITAYTHFASRVVSLLAPDFLAYAVEVNGLLANAPGEWPKFLTFARLVYKVLKAGHPHLPVFVTVQADYFWADAARQRQALAAVLPYTDMIAVSAYPYVRGEADPRRLPRDYLSGIAAIAPGKPFAVSETAFPAKAVPSGSGRIPGRAEWQDEYVAALLTESERLRARFVVWFVLRDYDALVARMAALHVPAQTLDLYRLWQPTGLMDGRGAPRPALSTWDRWLQRRRR
jgi:hypothetical protein